jgi:dCTP deaminase
VTVLSAQTLRYVKPVSPFYERTPHLASGTTFGLGPCGYDVRLDQNVVLAPGDFTLASTMEYFTMPADVVGVVHDKSTWARRGLAVQNTVIEPGWCGYLTLELTNHSALEIVLSEGTPVAQILFHALDRETDSPYSGKYQNQERGPQSAR